MIIHIITIIMIQIIQIIQIIQTTSPASSKVTSTPTAAGPRGFASEWPPKGSSGYPRLLYCYFTMLCYAIL